MIYRVSGVRMYVHSSTLEVSCRQINKWLAHSHWEKSEPRLPPATKPFFSDCTSKLSLHYRERYYHTKVGSRLFHKTALTLSSSEAV